MKQIILRQVSSNSVLTCSLLLYLITGGITTSSASSDNSVDISQWHCKFCPFEQLEHSEITLGLLYVNDNSYKYGEYTGLKESGGYPLLNAKLRYRNEDTSYIELDAEDLGLDKRWLDLEMGMQGKYRLTVGYDDSIKLKSNTAATPYEGVGTSTLSLPAGWVNANSSSDMTSLATSLHQVELKTRRQKVSFGAAIQQDNNWNYAVDFSREHRDGKHGTAGAFFFRSAELVMPIDYITDELDITASYTGKKLQTQLAYYSSLFSNNNQSLIWQNAFTPLVTGSENAELATSPNNEFHQISINTGYQITHDTRGMATIAIGRMRQNEAFSDSTLNTSLGAPPLPRNSLNGKIATLNANIKLHSKISDRLRVNATFQHDERDNKTPQANYVWASSDSFLTAPRTNLPYSFDNNSTDVKADYHLSEAVKLSAAIEHDINKRTFQEVERTTENTLWGKIKIRTDDKTDVALKYAHIDRDASEYTPVPAIDGAQNPLMRKYNMTNRKADNVSLHVNRAPYIHTQYSIGLDYENSDYDETSIGLTESESIRFNTDVNYTVTENSNVYFFYSREKINSEISGSQSFSLPDWSGRNEDDITTIGLGINHSSMENKLNLGMDFILTRSSGEIEISTTPEQAAFPELISKLDSLKLYADYKLKDDLTLSAAYWLESYDINDWAIDDVSETSVSSLLGFGDDNPTYNVSAVMLSLRYTFK